MALENNARRQRVSPQTFSAALSSATAEWLLMLLLFLDGLFSYLVTKFARYSKLQIPCLFCSRLDHILGRERPGFYKELICHAHKLDISSLAFCHIHQKLADVRDMCEDCLISFATEKKSNSETYRSLVGKLERNIVHGENGHLSLPTAVDPDGLEVKFQREDVVQVPLLKKDNTLGSPKTRYCSCCLKVFSEKSYEQRLLQTKSIGTEFLELDVGLFGQASHGCLHCGDVSRKKQDKPLGSSASFRIENHSFDPLSHVGYTELKVNSDSESDVMLSDDDDDEVASLVTNDVKEDHFSQSVKQEPPIELENRNALPKALLDDMALEKQIHTTSLPEPSCLPTVEQIHVVEQHDGDSSPSVPKSTIAHGLEELSWNEFKAKDPPSSPSKLISEKPSSNSVDEAEVSDRTHCVTIIEGTDHCPVQDKDISEVSNIKLAEVELGAAALDSSVTNMKEPKNSISTETELRQMQTANDPGSLMHNHMDLNDVYKLAIGSRMNQPSPRDSYRVHEDFKLLLSQISAARGLELPWSDMSPSPRVHGPGDDLKMSDASNTTSQQNLSKRFSIERNESGFESLDGSIVSEIEGESPVDRLKRHIELDRKSMSLLYKELEEERNASAIAANQAMAMITRLQEEKAAMQMEALQYQRMMEEQAEYDQEAVHKSNDLLEQKEEEVQDLKAEIESYKRWLGDESSSSKMKGDLEKKKDNPIDRPLIKATDDKKILERNNTVFMDAEGDKEVILKNSSLDFDDEKEYISECLKRLEEKLHMFSNNGVYVELSGPNVREDGLPDHVLENGHLYEKDTAEPDDLEQGRWHKMAHKDSQLGEEALSRSKESSFVGEDSHLCRAFSIKENHNGNSKLLKFDDEKHQSSMVSRTTDLVTVENEVLHLNDRLRTLEADRSFLEHIINSLGNGNGGVRFVQEIASHLRELRRIGVRRREQTHL